MRYLIILILLSGCSILKENKANRKAKRINRLVGELEQMGVNWQADTVYKNIPVFIPQVRVDSIFTSKVGDTVYISKDRLKIKFVHLKGDSVFIEGKCEADTIKIQVPVSVTKEIKSGLGIWTVIQWSLIALIVGFVVSKIWK